MMTGGHILQRLCAALLGTAMLLLAHPGAVRAEPRIALVVGNQDYENTTVLENPVSDAKLIAGKLARQGFAVTLLTDGDESAMHVAIADFGRQLRSAGPEAVGLFYYAGHAVQSFGSNYLLPVDVRLTDAADLGLDAIRADAVLLQMASARNYTNIVILDACRNNPFINMRGIDNHGLAEMSAPTGTFMAYSTAPGSVALDGSGTNSPFSTALADAIDQPGLPLEQAIKMVRSRVLDETNGRQTPWNASSLTRDFYFAPSRPESPEAVASRKFFESIKESGDPVQIVLFLRTYPDSEHFDEARRLLTQALDGPPGRETTEAPSAPPASVTAPPPPGPAGTHPGPSEREEAMIGRAYASGEVTDYEAYLEAFPDGTFAELARAEIQVRLDEAKAATGRVDSATSGETTQMATVEPGVLFDRPLTRGGIEIEGRSLMELIGGTPLYPPIPGLPDEVWKGRHCTTCHVWSREALCSEATSYIVAAGTRSLIGLHPYGGGFKDNLREWARGGCR
ncbi:caspase family protein [Tropicimonas sp.]|uniref:caspase family protein n=1 Tax=Tropicimonas sp. TaxID=2067044 RepID=UPI003A88EA50